jgi:hypothetical protein
MRKTIDYTITDSESRDKGKKFRITEMSAMQAEKWCYKAISGMIKSNVDLPSNIMSVPAESLAALGFASILRIDFDDLEPLLEELFNCVEYCAVSEETLKADKKSLAYRKINMEFGDIEEMGTLSALRLEVFKLHLGFLKAVLAPIFSQFTQSSE